MKQKKTGYRRISGTNIRIITEIVEEGRYCLIMSYLYDESSDLCVTPNFDRLLFNELINLFLIEDRFTFHGILIKVYFCIDTNLNIVTKIYNDYFYDSDVLDYMGTKENFFIIYAEYMNKLFDRIAKEEQKTLNLKKNE